MRRGDTAFMFGAVLEPRSSIRVVLSRGVGAAYNECPARVHPREDPELNHLLLPRARPFRFLMSAQRTGIQPRVPEGASLRATDGTRRLQSHVGRLGPGTIGEVADASLALENREPVRPPRKWVHAVAITDDLVECTQRVRARQPLQEPGVEILSGLGKLDAILEPVVHEH